VKALRGRGCVFKTRPRYAPISDQALKVAGPLPGGGLLARSQFVGEHALRRVAIEREVDPSTLSLRVICDGVAPPRTQVVVDRVVPMAG
jgi:hypothetical protein